MFDFSAFLNVLLFQVMWFYSAVSGRPMSHISSVSWTSALTPSSLLVETTRLLILTAF